MYCTNTFSERSDLARQSEIKLLLIWSGLKVHCKVISLDQ